MSKTINERASTSAKCNGSSTLENLPRKVPAPKPPASPSVRPLKSSQVGRGGQTFGYLWRPARSARLVLNETAPGKAKTAERAKGKNGR